MRKKTFKDIRECCEDCREEDGHSQEEPGSQAAGNQAECVEQAMIQPKASMTSKNIELLVTRLYDIQ